MAKRIKILYTIPNFDTAGSGKVVHDLVKYIDKTKFEPHIACKHKKGDFFKIVEQLNIPIHIFDVTTPYRPFVNLPIRVMKISRFFRQHDFDVIHSWNWSSDITEPIAARMAGIPFVYTKKAMGWGNKAWRWRSQLSSQIIIINRDMVKFFRGMEHKVSAIPIGLDTSIFTSKNKLHKLGTNTILQDEFVIVTVANLVPVKGIEVLLEAVKLLQVIVKVYIVGDKNNAYGNALEKKYANDHIVFTGKQLNIIQYLEKASVFVISTKDEGRKEGQPIAPLEAMLCGCPVIGSDISGIRDILSPFKDLIFEPGNHKDLADKLRRVMTMSNYEISSLTIKMQHYVKENYSLSRSIMLHEKLYLSLVKEGIGVI